MADRQRLVVPFAAGIAIVWGIVTLASLVTKQYTPLVTITPVMLIAAGFVLGTRDRNSDDEGKK